LKKGGWVKAIIYCRVSTQEQKDGYSLRQQEEALRRWCEDNGYDVLEVVQDVGSGSHLERPGLDRVRDLVDSGVVDRVVAQDLDRIARDNIYVGLLKKEFDRKSTRLYALNQRSDGSAEGELSDTILGAVAAFERQMITRRTTKGRLQKAKEGKVPNVSNYGFDNVEGYYVINDDMGVVHFLFNAIANHESLYSVAKTMNEQGIKSPRGGKIYGASLRKYITNDAYKPHTFDELSAIVSAEVLSKLDPEKNYGIVWYNTKSIEYEKTADYRMKQVKKTFKPKKDWIAIPVTDAGIPRETVEKARANLHDRSWQISKKNNRYFELSGGVAKCNVCGRNMSTTARKYLKKHGEQGVNYYYLCKNEFCEHKNKFHRVADLEGLAMGVLRDLHSDDSLIKPVGLRALRQRKEEDQEPPRQHQGDSGTHHQAGRKEGTSSGHLRGWQIIEGGLGPENGPDQLSDLGGKQAPSEAV
jgi:DNA invertase Pin-like site-specific DNA recombinase